jgi:uncharacterized membrane protein
MTRSASAAILAAVLVAGVWGVLHVGWYQRNQLTDYAVYQTYGDSVAKRHAVPYRDFRVEYPPAALPVFLIPSLLDRFDYRRMFQVLMALCNVAAVLAVFRLRGRRAALVCAVAPLALGSLVVSRFDLWPAALSVLALAAAIRGRRTTSALLVGTAFAAKLWPVVLVPLLGIWIARTAGAKAAWRWLAAAAGAAAAWFLPFVILSPAGVAHSFHAQLARPLQLESLGAAVLTAVHHLFGTTLHITAAYGSQNVTGPGAHAVEVATTIAGLIGLAALYLTFWRGDSDVDDLLRCSAAAVAVTIAFGKVFSPQFLIWLIPLVPLTSGRRGRAATAVFFAAMVLTLLWFPHHYWRLATNFGTPQSWEVLARDLAVVALAAILAWPRRLQHEVLGEHRSRIEALQRVRAQIE